MDADNRSSFQALQNAQPDTRVTFYAFDILMDHGEDVRALRLRDRLAHPMRLSTLTAMRCCARTFPDRLRSSPPLYGNWAVRA